MFKSWRLQLREAEEAVRAGRLDEAARLIREGDLQQCMPGKRLAVSVAEQLARRAQQRLQQDERAGGWRDLETAYSLGGQAASVLAIGRAILQQVVGEAESRLAGGDSAEAIRRLEAADRQGASHEGIRVLLEVARRLESARNLRDRGKFDEAEVQLERAASLRPDMVAIQDQRDLCRRQAQAARDLSEQLHKAMTGSDWTEALALASRLLELSPQSPLAADARRRAWMAVGAAADNRQPAGNQAASGAGTVFAGNRRRGHGGSENQLLERFLLWVDGVGGFLVCLDDEIVLGQAALGNRIAVPILADLSRHHAILRREDGYLIEPLGNVWIEGRPIHRTTVLSDGDEIRLGNGVVFRFRQPHPLSSTARLDLLSTHRTQPSADAILLMAESCVLGPKWQNHIVCRDWSGDVVLYRREGALYCRATEALEVDGRFCEGQERLSWDSHVSGSDFSLSLERIA